MTPQASAYEAQCVAETRQRCGYTAASIGGLARIGMTTEDAQQHLSVAVVAACRKWAEGHAEKPPPSYLNCAIRRRKLKLWRSIKTATEQGYQLDDDPIVADSTHDPEILASESERQSKAADWRAVLQHRLTPVEYALLKLRSEGFSNRDIETLGALTTGDNRGVRRRYYDAKQKAADFLRSCGIDNAEAAIEAGPRDRHAAWEKAIKKSAARK